MFGNLAHLKIDLIANRGHGFHEAGGLAIRTRRSNGAFERLLHSLSSNGHQPEIVKLENLGWRAIATQRLFQCLHKDRKSTRLNSSHSQISYAVFCLKKKKN